MKAFGVSEYQSPLRQLEIQIPLPPKRDEVAVKMLATTYNPVDVHIADGYGAQVMNRRKHFPVILGRDGCGEVTAVGENVRDLKPGQRVAIAVSPLTGASYQQYAVLPRRCVQPISDSLSNEEAAAVAYAGTTALQAIHATGLNARNAKGKRVCINGASGGLGASAVQILNYWGATVIAVCSERNHPWVQTLGAAELIDYRDVSAMAAIRANVIINGAPPAELKLKAVLRDPLAASLIRGSEHTAYSTVVTPMIGMITVLGVIPGVTMGLSDYLRRKIWFSTVKGARYRWVIFKEKAGELKEVVDFFGSGAAQSIVRERHSINALPELFNAKNAQKNPGKTVFTWD